MRTKKIAKKIKKKTVPALSSEIIPEQARFDDKNDEKNISRLHRARYSKALRIIFLWIPLALISFIIVVLTAIHIFITPSRVEKLAVENFNSTSNGQLSLNVRKFSPYSEILIENIVIKNPAGYEGNFLEIKEIAFRYGFFSMLIGRVHFDEIGIYSPKVFLSQKKGVWNTAVLMKKTGVPEEPEKKEEKPLAKKSSSEISLPFPVRFFMNLALEDLRVYVKGESFTTKLEGITFRAKVNIPPFRKIPMSVAAVTLLKDMNIELNPEEKLDLSFFSADASVEPPLILNWKLLYSKDSREFKSSLKFGTYKTPVRFRRAHLAPLDFLLSYDLYYDPIKDFMRLDDLSIKFRNRRWISLSGAASAVSKNPQVNINMSQSEIALTDLYPYYRAITGDDSLRFGGTVSLMPFTVKGSSDSLAVRGSVAISSLEVKIPDFEMSIPRGKISFSMDMSKSKSKIGAELSLSDFSYLMERSRSGLNGLSVKCDIDSFDDFSRFRINRVDARFYNPATKENILRLGLKGDIGLVPSVNGSVILDQLYFNKLPLVSILPESLKKSVRGVPFSKPVTGSADLVFSMGSSTDARLGLMLKIPDFDVNDLYLKADISQKPVRQRIDIKSMTLDSRSRGFLLEAKGFVETKTAPISDSDLKIKLVMNHPEMVPVYGPWNLAGKVSLNAAMKGDTVNGKARGSLEIENLSLKNTESRLFVDTLNLAFPFEYDFAYKPEGGSRIAMDKSSIIENIIFKEKENLTIKGISLKHPAREESVAYLKNTKGTLFFKKNAFEIQKLSSTVLGGSFLMKDTFFYLSDLNMKNMEYNLAFDLTNVDVGILDTGRKTTNAELSANAKISGRSLDFSREMNISGYVNIFKIGDKFANRLMKGLSVEKGKSKLGIAQWAVDNTELPKSFSYYIDRGIMYTDVTFKRKFIGNLIHVEDDRVRLDRIPIQEYLRKVKE